MSCTSGVTLVPPSEPSAVHGEVVLHVVDCRATYAELVARRPPWGHEVRAFLATPTAIFEISQAE